MLRVYGIPREKAHVSRLYENALRNALQKRSTRELNLFNTFTHATAGIGDLNFPFMPCETPLVTVNRT